MKKILSVLLAFAMIFSVMATGVVNASATSVFNGAKKIDALDTVSMDKTNGSVTKYYKIILPDSGKIRFHCDKNNVGLMSAIELTLLKSNGKTIRSNYFNNGILEKDFEIKEKGVYYIKINKGGQYWFENFYYTFEPDNTPTISISLKMDVGDKIDIGATVSNYDGKVSFKTTKKSVATVSKGKIIAKKKGKAKIRAYMDNGTYAEIVVIVKDDE